MKRGRTFFTLDAYETFKVGVALKESMRLDELRQKRCPDGGAGLQQGLDDSRALYTRLVKRMRGADADLARLLEGYRP